MTKLCIAGTIACVSLLSVPATLPAQSVRSYDPWSSDAEKQAETRIHTALAKRLDFDFADVALKDFVEFLKQLGVPARLDHRALDDAGIGDDVPVRLQQSGITVRSALDLVLDPLDLAWMIRSEVLLITTPEEAESMLLVRIYDVTDLVLAHVYVDNSGRSFTSYEFESLNELIRSTVAPQTWDYVGGPASIGPLELNHARLLVVSQTREVQEQVATLLQGLLRIDRERSSNVSAHSPAIRRSTGLPRSQISRAGRSVP